MSYVPISTGVSGLVEQGISCHDIDPAKLAALGPRTYRADGRYVGTGNYWGCILIPGYSVAQVMAPPRAGTGPYYPVTDPRMADWVTDVSARAKECKYLAPTNEPTAVSAQNTYALLKLTYAPAHAANPNVKVVGPCYYEGIVGRFVDLMNQFLAIPGVFDVIDLFEYHYYPGSPEKIFDEMNRVYAVVAAAAAKQGKPALETCMTETGWTTFPGVPSSVTPAQLIDYWSFCPILMRACTGLRMMQYYMLHDDAVAGAGGYNNHFGVYDSNYAEKAPGQIAVIKKSMDEAHAATSARAYLVDGVYYVWYTAPDERLAIRCPAGTKTVTINTGAGPLQVTVGTRATYLKGSTYPDFGGIIDNRDAQIMALQAQLQAAQQQLTMAQAELAAALADAATTDQELADAQAAVTVAEQQATALQAKIDAAKAALA